MGEDSGIGEDSGMAELSKPIIAIFAFYLIISGNFLTSLFNPGLNKIIHKNYWIKHFIGFITLYFLVTWSTERDPDQSLVEAAVLYCWFLLTIFMNNFKDKTFIDNFFVFFSFIFIFFR